MRHFTLGIELIDNPEWMGGTLYLRNLALSLARLPENTRPNIRLLGAESVVADIRKECDIPGIFNNQRGGSFWGKLLRKLGWSSPARNSSVDVVYPGFGADVPGAVTVHWIPDFQHRYLPELFSSEEIEARERSIGEIASKPGVVVLSSEVAAADFRHFFPGHRATPRVWHFCSLINTSNLELHNQGLLHDRHGIPEQYLYLPNQFWVHKNHITVLKALARIRRRHHLVIPLVCTGVQADRRNEAHFNHLMNFTRESGIIDQVYFLGLLPRLDQIAVLRAATAVVQPSLFEGWSTVVEDVRSVGRPIFLSDIPVHREQSPEHAIYFAPENDAELATLLAEKWHSLCADSDLMAEEAAQTAMQERVLVCAQQFCQIAKDAFTMERHST